MRFCLAIAAAFLGAGLLIGDEVPTEGVKKDLARLQGTWTTTGLTWNGKDFLAGGKSGFQFVIKDDVVIVEGNDAVKREYARLKLKLDTATTPKIVDMKVLGGIQKDAVIEGIYDLKAHEFRICARVFGKERPLEFSSPAGASVVLLVLKKETP